jgi:hypothetical protein
MGATMKDLAASVAAELLSRDGTIVIWQAHMAAARVYRDGYPKAAEILLRIADAAEEAARCAADEDVAGAAHSATSRRGGVVANLLPASVRHARGLAIARGPAAGTPRGRRRAG